MIVLALHRAFGGEVRGFLRFWLQLFQAAEGLVQEDQQREDIGRGLLHEHPVVIAAVWQDCRDRLDDAGSAVARADLGTASLGVEALAPLVAGKAAQFAELGVEGFRLVEIHLLESGVMRGHQRCPHLRMTAFTAPAPSNRGTLQGC